MVERRTLEDRATDEIRQSLLDGHIEPGERLTEVDLSERLKVSRGTVRLALQNLAGAGLVTLTPYSGWHVESFTATDAWELAVLRGSLEGLAAELVAKRCASEGPDVIEAATHSLASLAAESGSSMTDADFGFHYSIVEAARNKRLAVTYSQIEAQTRLLISTANQPQTSVGEIVAQHQPILDAISSGDPDTARFLAEKHGRESGESLIITKAAQ